MTPHKTFIMPFPISTNNYWAPQWLPKKRRVNMRLTKAARDYKKKLADMFAYKIVDPIEGEVMIVVELTPPDKRRRDIDNFAGKALLDAIVDCGYLQDDSQIKEKHVRWLPPDKNDSKAVVQIYNSCPVDRWNLYFTYKLGAYHNG